MGVVDNVKDIADLVKKIGDIELYKKILALEEEVMDLTRDKRRADDRIEELERTLNIRQDIIFRDGEYFLTRNGREEGPFCSLCWDRDGKLIRKSKMLRYGIVCPACAETQFRGVRR
jgi:hypothetical protein